MELSIFNRKVTSLFQLLGQKENHISYSVGYALSYSPKFLDIFLRSLGIKVVFEPSKIAINLQLHESKGGFTDFEIIHPDFHIIIEAKRGWSFPSQVQLDKYVNRPSFKASSVKTKLLVIFNESTVAYTTAHFPVTHVQGIPVKVFSWIDVQRLTSQATKLKPYSENFILHELTKYIEQISTMQKKDSNLVYVVSLGPGIPKDSGWKLTFQDVVNKHRKYFHPIGGKSGGWPAVPPNYIAFRYNGMLQSIHHITNYQVFTDPSKHIPQIPKGNWEPHYLYDLGPAIIPATKVVTGKRIPRSMRVWAAIDLLLTSSSIEEARDRTKLR